MHEENGHPGIPETGDGREAAAEDITAEETAAETTVPGEPAAEEPAPPPLPDLPVSLADRIGSLDVLRGAAVLGIYLVNILAFNMPSPAFMNPHLAGYDQFGDGFAYAVVFLLALQKTMPIFSILFGAGIILFTERVEARDGRSGRRWFARQWWLWIIGLLHGYVLWNGDILVPYAVVGLTLYKLRKLKVRTLVILAVVFSLVPMGGMYGLGEGMKYIRGIAVEAEALEADGEELTEQQEQFLEIWNGSIQAWDPSLEEMAEIKETMRGDYAGIFKRNGGELLQQHFVMYPLIVNWSIASYMLLGMALFRAGALQAARSDRFYIVLLAVGYGIGLPGSWVSMQFTGEHIGDMVKMLQGGMQVHTVSGVLMALGHIALVVLAVRRGWLGGLQTRLAAAGRMAFTNYLSQTVISIVLFYGYGFGMWGGIGRLGLLGIVLAVWIVQLAWSPWWLARFRFGPAEWLWRSLTYGKRQRMKRSATAES